MAAGQLGRTQRDLTQSLIRIGSGFRVNRAADDAAGLGVATNLTTLARSTRMAMRNINEGISLIQAIDVNRQFLYTFFKIAFHQRPLVQFHHSHRNFVQHYLT
ncbi:MAG: hypothetical protein ACK559_10590, partial [bacterium]